RVLRAGRELHHGRDATRGPRASTSVHPWAEQDPVIQRIHGRALIRVPLGAARQCSAGLPERSLHVPAGPLRRARTTRLDLPLPEQLQLLDDVGSHRILSSRNRPDDVTGYLKDTGSRVTGQVVISGVEAYP